MLRACTVCGAPSDQVRCPTHRISRPKRAHELKQRQRILERDGWQCRRCGTRLGPMQVDHIVPLATTPGPRRDDELQTLCRSCNASKGDRIDR